MGGFPSKISLEEKMKKALVIVLVALMAFSAFASPVAEVKEEGPLKFSMYYSDNATLPFKESWLAVQEATKSVNAEIQWEIIPIADYSTKVSLALNTQTNAPDVILYQTTTGENASLALNGAIVPISDYSEWTPCWNAMVEKYGMEDDVELLKLQDGKRYYLPSLTDVPFYDGGLILREDFLKAEGFDAPKTFDDLYAILKAYKAKHPESYPLTVLAGPRVLYRMTMPSFGLSIGKNGSGGSRVLSWNYDEMKYFPAAISEEFKAYLAFFGKLYAEGLLDPEMAEPIDGSIWSRKMATGAAIATWAYYDQIGGVTAASTIEGFKLQMYPALAGPAGAHHQQKNRTGSGIMFPAATAKRADFEQIVRAVDKMFFSEENSKLWCIGVEGTTYTMDGDKIVYADNIKKAAEGIYKYMQLEYGCGSDVTQMVWVNAREMTKYDENYAQINKAVEAMGNVIQYIPPTPKFDDMEAEEAAMLMTPLADKLEVWCNAFLTGKKSLDKDWNAYVAEMKGLQIEKYCDLYNANL